MGSDIKDKINALAMAIAYNRRDYADNLREVQRERPKDKALLGYVVNEERLDREHKALKEMMGELRNCVEPKTAWTSLSERMPDEYPCLVSSVDGRDVFVAGRGLEVFKGRVIFVCPNNSQLSARFRIDQSEWAPIPK